MGDFVAPDYRAKIFACCQAYYFL